MRSDEVGATYAFPPPSPKALSLAGRVMLIRFLRHQMLSK